MSKYQRFIYKSYEFNQSTHQLKLTYSYDNVLDFCETYTFDFDFIDFDQAVLDRALQLLFFMAGVSYYKMYVAPDISIEQGQLDEQLAHFFDKTYQKGLGEFLYLNKLDPRLPIQFPVTVDEIKPMTVPLGDGQLIGIGGGKDSLVSVEILGKEQRVATWSLNHRSQLRPLIERIGLPHFWVERQLDSKILELNKQDALNGHIPISAIFSCVGLIVSILTGYRDAVVSNESSASEPNLAYDGVSINHQYSKSLEYEQDFQTCLTHCFGNSVRYYSLLRPFSELRIAEMFAKDGFDTYKDVFSSCNRAYTHDQHQLFWCGECAKCAFTCLIFTPFIEPSKLFALWGGKNLLLEPSLEKTYQQLLGIEGDKPLDCVGEIKEARTAMRLCQKRYPELAKYSFDLPEGYDFRAWSLHAMPDEIFSLLQSKEITES